MSKPDAPAPPNFTGAAQATGQSNIMAAIIQRIMSMQNSNTPWGSLAYNQTGTQHVPGFGNSSVTSAPSPSGGLTTVSPGGAAGAPGGGQDLQLPPAGTPSPGGAGTPSPATGGGDGGLSSGGYDLPTFTSTITLSPEQQAIFNQQQQNQLSGSQTAGDILGGLDTSPIDFSGAPGMPSTGDLEGTRTRVADAIYGRQSRYLDPQFQQAEEAERTRLANSGFQTGTEGFSKAIGDFNLSKQRAYGDARDAAMAQSGAEMSRDFGMGLAGRQQAISELLTKRQLPLNMLSALQGGPQVGMPQFPGSPGGQGVQGTDYTGAAGAQANANMQNYGIQAGQYNSQMGGLYGLGSAALMAMMMSDRRFKKNIRRIAEHPLGIGVYAFDYLDGQPAIGVMADEVERVLPAAVATDARGYKFVNYNILANPQPNMVL